ncbi:hypothetical protein [Salinigranum salinum]|uniref:hypothetical protein n=1 Tax=Salinigranum salinum TaxID=1364937 RepID=UPI001260490B|nr:hypothetical protein [Salinigranum salinum]
MARSEDGVWRTLARIYVSVFACGLFVPTTAAVPVLFGVDSLFVTLVFGGVGVGVAAGATFFAGARLDTAVDSLSLSDDLDDSDPPIPAGSSGE